MSESSNRKGPEFGLVVGVVLGIALGMLWKEMAVGVLVGGGIGLLLFSRSRGRREREE
ncbi:hypothetical protein [Dinghuibacter silviterrae]|uniref:hypothetical protein n=1 Tax=Dinghuibacter silviterrae TaxID=1539049 RepID=UPI0013C34AC4|nr:hypothetical protein [Dinghuibacter silviterrae]